MKKQEKWKRTCASRRENRNNPVKIRQYDPSNYVRKSTSLVGLCRGKTESIQKYMKNLWETSKMFLKGSRVPRGFWNLSTWKSTNLKNLRGPWNPSRTSWMFPRGFRSTSFVYFRCKVTCATTTFLKSYILLQYSDIAKPQSRSDFSVRGSFPSSHDIVDVIIRR